MRVVHWFRNDLRLRDNTALAFACARADELLPLFVADPRFADEPLHQRRFAFLTANLQRLATELDRKGCPLVVLSGDPVQTLERVFDELRPDLLTFNRDYSPYAVRRDDAVAELAARRGVDVQSCKDRVVFESTEIRTKQGGPYRVYGPYRRAWLRQWSATSTDPLTGAQLPRAMSTGALRSGRITPGAASIDLPAPGEQAAHRRLASFLKRAVADYRDKRNIPAVDGTSRLSPYLRFGVLSPRQCLHQAFEFAEAHPNARDGVDCWVDELIWREFYQAVLAQHPSVLRRAYRPEFVDLEWDDNPALLQAWKDGMTGYPIIDAGMRQLRQLGWMHNRLRMLTASFLTKDLLLDWRLGERHFLASLIDGDPAANNGGWQWSASTGTDAQPYFRIFHPVTQGKRFDPEGKFVRRYVPELARVPIEHVHEPWLATPPPPNYPPPIVEHAAQRLEALRRFRAARETNR